MTASVLHSFHDAGDIRAIPFGEREQTVLHVVDAALESMAMAGSTINAVAGIIRTTVSAYSDTGRKAEEKVREMFANGELGYRDACELIQAIDVAITGWFDNHGCLIKRDLRGERSYQQISRSLRPGA